MGREEIGEVVERLRPDRIGHGILAAGDDELMSMIRDLGITLEICPTSNLLTKALPDEDAVHATRSATFVEHDVPFTIATDGPEMMRTHLRDELELLLRIGALDEAGAPRGERARTRRSVPAARRRRRMSSGASDDTSRSGSRPRRIRRRGSSASTTSSCRSSGRSSPVLEVLLRLPARDQLHARSSPSWTTASATSTTQRSSRPRPRSSSTWRPRLTTGCAFARATRTTCSARRTARRSRAPLRARSR